MQLVRLSPHVATPTTDTFLTRFGNSFKSCATLDWLSSSEKVTIGELFPLSVHSPHELRTRAPYGYMCSCAASTYPHARAAASPGRSGKLFVSVQHELEGHAIVLSLLTFPAELLTHEPTLLSRARHEPIEEAAYDVGHPWRFGRHLCRAGWEGV